MNIDYKHLFEQKSQEYTELKNRYEQYQDTSKQMEIYYESRIQILDQEINKFSKINNDYKSQLQNLNQENMNLNTQIQKITSQQSSLNEFKSQIVSQKVDFENEIEILEQQCRLYQDLNQQIEDKVIKLTEENVILTEEKKNIIEQYEIRIQRMQDQIKELENDIYVKNNRINSQIHINSKNHFKSVDENNMSLDEIQLKNFNYQSQMFYQQESQPKMNHRKSQASSEQQSINFQFEDKFKRIYGILQQLNA